MKQLPIVAVIMLTIVLLVQNGGSAGPRGTPPVLRTVPVNVMEVMQPSKMVAVSRGIGGAVQQVPVPLEVGQVFVLTSWSLNSVNSSGRVPLLEGPVDTLAATRDFLWVTSSNEISHHHVIPTGIRFPRDAGGLADVYIGGIAPNVYVSLQGYITDDF